MFKKLVNYIKSKRTVRALKRLSPQMLYGFNSTVNGYLKDTRIGSTSVLISEEKLDIKDNVFIGQYNFIEASNGICIHEGCQITNYISILTHSSHNSIRYYGKHYRNHKDLVGYVKGPVSIGKYTFVGPHVTIMPGTTIGKGSIVSSYSFLKGEFPDFSIIAGNPAKVVGSTRERDLELLKDDPELMSYYKEWADE